MSILMLTEDNVMVSLTLIATLLGRYSLTGNERNYGVENSCTEG